MVVFSCWVEGSLDNGISWGLCWAGRIAGGSVGFPGCLKPYVEALPAVVVCVIFVWVLDMLVGRWCSIG